MRNLTAKRLLRILRVVGAHVGQRLVDRVVVGNLAVGLGLQLPPRRDDDEAAENAGLRVERLQRVDRIAAVAHELEGAHRDEAANGRLDRWLCHGTHRG